MSVGVIISSCFKLSKSVGDMSNLQNESLKDLLIEDITLAHNLRNYLSSLNFESKFT